MLRVAYLRNYLRCSLTQHTVFTMAPIQQKPKRCPLPHPSCSHVTVAVLYRYNAAVRLGHRLIRVSTAFQRIGWRAFGFVEQRELHSSRLYAENNGTSFCSP